MSLEINQVSLYDRGRIVTGGGSGGGDGILPHLIVISETGSTVTATKGQTVITATETSTGHFECDLPEFGTWTIDAILGGDDAQVSLVVDTVKVYIVDDSHFHATVTVKYPTGATCRLQSADETLYATGSPYTFTVHHAETYTITVTYNQRIYTDTVTFTTEGQSFSKTLPTPSEIDVINDIDIWLWYGDVSGTFSTLSDILGNSTALSILMASTDAVDYLVRCKEWIDAKGLVPVMTSNTTPSGECFADSIISSGYEPFKVFDGNNLTYWGANDANPGHYVGYDFKSPICIKKIGIEVGASSSTSAYLKTFKVQASNDGSTWDDLSGTLTITSAGVYQYFTINNNTRYNKYRIYSLSSITYTYVRTVQFYAIDEGVTDSQSAMSYIGLNNYCANTLLADADWLDGICNSEYFESVLNVKVPTMTSATTPSGEVSASSFSQSTEAPFKAFDGNDSTFWTSQTSTNSWVQYEFTNNCKVCKVDILPAIVSSKARVKNFKIQASSDDTTFDDLLTETFPNEHIKHSYNFVNDTNCKYYRLFVTDSYDTSGPIKVETLQFYGREDV